MSLQQLGNGSDGAGSRGGSLRASRRPSEIALAELTGKICEGCLSRCATHSSLTKLDEEEDDAELLDIDGSEHPAHDPTSPAAEKTATTSLATARPAPISPSSEVSAMVTTCATRCGTCEVCDEVEGTWMCVVRRALKFTLGATLAYLLWLRFVASRETVRRHLFGLTRTFGQRFFSYGVIGGERIPKSGPAIITAYHGFVPLDLYFLHEYIHRTTGRVPTTLAANFVFRIPLFGYFCRVCGAVPASRKNAWAALQAGGLVVVAPGGVREAMTTSAEDYLLRWYGKMGFAEIAHAAGVPIIPMFTRNMREVFLVLGGSLPLVQKLYKLTRLPFTPFLGPLPMPLTSVLGAPVAPGGADSAAEVAQRVRDALQELICNNR